MDKQKAIEEMANAMGIALFNTYNGGILSKGEREAVAEELIGANYGNIPQALTEFAELLKATILILVPNCTISEASDETLKEFLK